MKIEKLPEFTHKQINLLYENDLSIDENILAEILSLPRQSLIDDLNKVLKDSIVRFDYFNDRFDNDLSEEKESYFLIHALFLLSEIEAVESKNNILEILRQDEEFFDFYLGDILTESMWWVLYKICSTDLDACKKLIFDPNIYLFAKSSIPRMAGQIALHHPERRDEIIDWFRDVFHFYLNADDSEIDVFLITMFIDSTGTIKGKELLPEIKELFDREMVDLMYFGTFEDFKNIMNEKDTPENKEAILSIYEMYQEILSWPGNDDDYYYDEDYKEELKRFEENLVSSYLYEQALNDSDTESRIFRDPYVRKEKKVGRNDPCPCGSGKKYKKCCMKL